MHFLQRTLVVAVAATAIAASADAAMAHGYNSSPANMMFPTSRSYSGSWPVTITHSIVDNGTDCLTLNGTARGGSASLVADGTKYPYGSFLVLKGILVATIVKPSGSQNGALMFIAHATDGNIGQGVFENIEGGSNFDAGDLTFGMKNGC